MAANASTVCPMAGTHGAAKKYLTWERGKVCRNPRCLRQRGLRSLKNTPAAAFSTRFALFAREPVAPREENRNPLLRKGSVSAAHVAGNGLKVRGL